MTIRANSMIVLVTPLLAIANSDIVVGFFVAVIIIEALVDDEGDDLVDDERDNLDEDNDDGEFKRNGY